MDYTMISQAFAHANTIQNHNVPIHQGDHANLRNPPSVLHTNTKRLTPGRRKSGTFHLFAC